MRRREFIAGLAAWPVAARAQQAMPVIGFLSPQSADDDSKNYTIPFLQGLKEAGYVEGQNVAVEYRHAENQFDRLPALASDLVRRRVAVIVSFGLAATLAAKAATTSIPIVFATGVDPIASGLVGGLNRPGGNLTGSTVLSTELAPKRLQLLRELIPNAGRFGVLWDPAVPDIQSQIADLQAAARTLGLKLIVVDARTDSDLETAFATFSQQHVGAVLVSASNFFERRMEQLAALEARRALPAIFPFREFVLAGGLMSYGSSLGYMNHQAGIYAGRILKGEKPADLPVQQATKLELVVNLKTAKALGLTIPETLLATADEVIQQKGGSSSLDWGARSVLAPFKAKPFPPPVFLRSTLISTVKSQNYHSWGLQALCGESRPPGRKVSPLTNTRIAKSLEYVSKRGVHGGNDPRPHSQRCECRGEKSVCPSSAAPG
jgi:putative ABC transport system substrate-binding protein